MATGKPGKSPRRRKDRPLSRRKPLSQMTAKGRAQALGKRALADERKAAAKAAKAAVGKGHSDAWKKSHAARRPKGQTKAMLEGKARALREKAALKPVRVDLKTFHFVNGQRYGPGPALVPQGIALAILETDRRALEAEDALFSQRSHIILGSGQGSGARAVQVATPSFDQLWMGANSPIFGQVSGKGVVDAGEGPRF